MSRPGASVPATIFGAEDGEDEVCEEDTADTAPFRGAHRRVTRTVDVWAGDDDGRRCNDGVDECSGEPNDVEANGDVDDSEASSF
jgi:hypothetical protein